MPNIRDSEMMPRKLLPIIYVLDTSGSMYGDRISAVNEAMHDTVILLKDIADKEPTAEIKMGVLQFASNAKWVTNGLISPENFFWNDLNAGGMTDLGAALEELDKKLSRNEWMISEVGFKAPVIIFMSDGGPTDDYVTALNRIKASNKWYRIATKIAIAVGDDADRQVLSQIASGDEAVIGCNNPEALKELIKVVSVTASQIGSKSHVTDSNLAEILGEVKNKMSDVSDIDVSAPEMLDTNIISANNSVDEDDDGWPVSGDFKW